MCDLLIEGSLDAIELSLNPLALLLTLLLLIEAFNGIPAVGETSPPIWLLLILLPDLRGMAKPPMLLLLKL
jgi:hypothetical protein